MDKKTEVKRLLEKAESQKGIERAKTLKVVLEIVASSGQSAFSRARGDCVIATVKMKFSFSGVTLDGLNDVANSVLEDAFRKIDAAPDLKSCQMAMRDFYKANVQQKGIMVSLQGVGNCQIIPSAKLRGEIENCVSNTTGQSGLQTAKKVAKRLLAALVAMQEIVAKGTASAFVKSDHKLNDKATYSRVFHVMPGRFPCSVLFTIKKSETGEYVPYHLNAEGSSSFERAFVEYLNSMRVVGDEVEVEGEIRMPL